MLKKVILFTILSAILFSSFSIFAFAYQLNEGNASVEGYYLYNIENDLVMAQKNISKQLNASSTVKIMSACIALESGIPMDQTITISKPMLDGVSGRFMGLKDGDKMSFGDLLYSMICASFNDATHAIAYTVAGSLERFVDMMNHKAQDLQMSSTLYTDATGMSSASKTSISDILRLVEHMLLKEEYIKIASTKTYTLSSLATCEYNKITNRSGLISAYKGFANFNIGSSTEGGDYAISYMNNGKSSFICIVMNACAYSENDTENYAEYYTQKLLNHGIYDYSLKTILTQKTIIDSLPVKYSIGNDTVDLYLENDLKVFLSDEVDTSNDLTFNYYLYDDELKAPLRAGDKVGVIVVSKNGRYLGSASLIVRETVERNFFLFLMDGVKSYLLSRAFAITLISLVAISVGYYFYRKRSLDKMFGKNRKKRNRYVN